MGSCNHSRSRNRGERILTTHAAGRRSTCATHNERGALSGSRDAAERTREVKHGGDANRLTIVGSNGSE
jgi:hypothetical protein